MSIKRALISVWDKVNIIEFSKNLVKKNIEILATGGTAKLLTDNNIKVIEISKYTGFPEIMNGRIKTINHKIHGGILARRDKDTEIMHKHNILPIDLVVVNLYPFQQTIAKANTTLEDAIENIDIGGPAMLRAAAKNHKWTTVITDSNDYHMVLNEITTNNNNTTLKTRTKLALKAFRLSAQYDLNIANYLSNKQDSFVTTLNLELHKKQNMCYGENPHQKSAFYAYGNTAKTDNIAFKQLQGKTMSYNNLIDADTAFECVNNFEKPSCVIVKHANPCGAATANNILTAYKNAYKTDPTSAFGGIIAFNRPLNKVTAHNIINKQFVEIIIAPSIATNAKNILTTKPNIRVLAYRTFKKPQTEYKSVAGGILVQDKDLAIVNIDDIKCVSKLKPTANQMTDLLFAYKIAKAVKSNAIVYASNETTIGIGAGQMSRLYSVKIASIKAKDENLQITGAVMASDAFFPFRDAIDMAKDAGINAIIQPGGSINDNETIQAANENNIAMVFTKLRHFKH